MILGNLLGSAYHDIRSKIMNFLGRLAKIIAKCYEHGHFGTAVQDQGSFVIQDYSLIMAKLWQGRNCRFLETRPSNFLKPIFFKGLLHVDGSGMIGVLVTII